MTSEFSRLLLGWYAVNARSLPWRGSLDPYAVWVSEIMLQQTRVDTVEPYYRRWMDRFPTIQALAQADQQEVLQLWEGLGYYSRARNLHQAARLVNERYCGQLPTSRSELESLPGIGRYTAGAIASIAFGADEPVLDGNIRRVITRVFNIQLPARSPEGEERILAALRDNMPPGKASEFNQALMDLGATICLPRDPKCSRCPFIRLCQAHLLGIEAERPVLTSKSAIPHYTVTAAVIRRDDLVLIARRPSKGLLGGMWEFPGGKVEKGEGLQDSLRREIKEELDVQIEVGDELGVFKHAYTHFKVTLHAFYCQLKLGEPRAIEASDLHWVQPAELGDYPMGKLDRQIACLLS
jgi:A/G-specific adenine glycosylase